MREQWWRRIALGPPERRTAISQLVQFGSAASGCLRDHQQLKGKASQPGGGWLRRAGGFTGRKAPANKLLKSGYAVSDNKTNFQLSIFQIVDFFLKYVARPLLARRDVHPMHLDGSRNRADAARTKTEHPGIRFS
jgi:hypothetical protein